jgi:GNAT superfamily N-acetyltransferase
MTLSIHEAASLNPETSAAIWDLLRPQYPDDGYGWTLPQWHCVTWDKSGVALAHAGIVGRQGTCAGRLVWIGGIAGVRTRENVRRLGLATTTLRYALAYLRQSNVDLVLLVCEPELNGFYEGFGFVPFTGTLEATRPVSQGAMVLPFRRMPKESIDLCGLPW